MEQFCPCMIPQELCPPCPSIDPSALVFTTMRLAELNRKNMHPAADSEMVMHMTCTIHPGHCIKCDTDISGNLLIRLAVPDGPYDTYHVGDEGTG